ncbi:MAG TPA: hypothetical protein VFC44_26900 [Candidatus Saccharimonadales bacterium]|nr:hypothetical protein [Candidatus Saccharimonadales bacterium]
MSTAAKNEARKSPPERFQPLPRRVVAILRRFEVNRAVFFSILVSGWSALAGPVTMLVIAHWMTAVEQGFYYTFSSVLALQVFVELGLVTVIIQVASHEWAFLERGSDDRISGDPRALSRLASLLRFALKWYAVSGLLVMAGLSLGGFIFFSAKPHPEVVWRWPWFALCGIAGVALMMSPIFSIIEGCNQVASIYSFRFTQGILNSLAVIVSLFLGLGLYALAIAALMRFMCGLVFIAWKHRVFIRQLLTSEITERINWRGDVWPFQWRIGVSWISVYFTVSIFTPVMFYYHGPEVAGRMGMTWAMVCVIETLSCWAWINTRMPHFGMLIARRQFAELDRLFLRLFWISLGVAVVCSLGLLELVYWLQERHLPLGERMLPLFPTILFLVQRIINVAISAMAFYLRAHKQEPLLFTWVVAALLTALSTWTLGVYYGPAGAAGGYLAVSLIWTLPACYYVFRHCRTLWHGSPSTVAIRAAQ